jgi:hypothetical protein
MLCHELFEAPIGDLEVHHMDKPGTFPDADRKLLQTSVRLCWESNNAY